MDVVVARLCSLGIEYLDLNIQKSARVQVRPFNAKSYEVVIVLQVTSNGNFSCMTTVRPWRPLAPIRRVYWPRREILAIFWVLLMIYGALIETGTCRVVREAHVCARSDICKT